METNEESKSVLIIANGEAPGDDVLFELVSKSDIIIAVDGGSNICFQKNITPDFIIGDLDSVDQSVLAHFGSCEIIKITDQDLHDLDKALQFTQTLKPKMIRVTAAFGKRFDHSMANLLLLQRRYQEQSLEFYDKFGCLSMISGDYVLDQPIGQIVSLFSFLPVVGLSLDGFKYILKDVDYPLGFIGLSNIMKQQKATIRIKKGSLFLYITNENIKP
jgi:thiamine pyrophosphokinase